MKTNSCSSPLVQVCIAVSAISASIISGPTHAQDSRPAAAAPKGTERVQITGSADASFESIQAAIDAAKDGDAIRIGEGRYDERLRIQKKISLIGAGSGKTILGPSLAGQVRKREMLDELIQRIESGRLTEEERMSPQKLKEQIESLQRDYSAPVIEIKDTLGVELRNLCVTMPDSPRKGTGLVSADAISIKRSGVSINECAVVGCMGGGIHASDGSDVTIQNCLIAGVWGTGVAMLNREAGRFRISNSEIRNCYHNNIWTGPYSDPCLIERCRISGSAWFGIRYGDKSPAIEHNAVFENARSGIYAEGSEGMIRGNLLYGNSNGGLACLYSNKATIEKNLFADNQEVAVWVNGDGEPIIHQNVFLRSPCAISYGPLSLGQLGLKQLTPVGKYHVKDNLFWRVEKSVVLRVPVKSNGPWKDREIADADAANQIIDPKVTIGSDLVWQVDDSSPARQFGLELELARIPTKSRWPITEEEKSMIPDDGTREWSKWKMRR